MRIRALHQKGSNPAWRHFTMQIENRDGEPSKTPVRQNGNEKRPHSALVYEIKSNHFLRSDK